MSPLDAAFLRFEDGITHLHIASCAIFEGPPPELAELVGLMRTKLSAMPRYRQRVRFIPLGLGLPVWVDDPTFAVDEHVQRVALPPPGGDAELRALMAWAMEGELDRDRPLWESWMVEGLADGRWAVISKVHHCMVDGIAGVDLLTALLDVVPDGPTDGRADDGWSPEPEPSRLALAGRALAELLGEPWVLARSAGDGLRHPRAMVAAGRDVAAGFLSYLGHLAPVPRTSISRPIGPHRRWTWASVELADVKAARRAFGATVNDIVVAAVTRGFRELLLARGEPVDTTVVRSLVPVSVRPQELRGTYHNLVSAMFAELPVAASDPVKRLAAVRDHLGGLKHSHQVDAGRAMTAAASAIPALFTALAERTAIFLAEHYVQRSVQTVTTNVPGPQFPLFALGRRLLEYLPYVPISPGVPIGVAVLSYDGRLAFGVTGDWRAAPDIQVVADGIEAEVAELVARARKPAFA